jgi:hypothetical protein
VSDAASRLKVSVTMHPTALYRIVVSLSRIHAKLLLLKPNATRQARLEAEAKRKL